MEQSIEKLKYPIGEFNGENFYTSNQVKAFIETLRLFPDLLRNKVASFDNAILDTPYRNGGWTIRQVVHHLADSHLNALLRFKLCLTEDKPTIKPYNEAAFAKLNDYELPVQNSLNVLQGIHYQWVYLLDGMKLKDFERTYYHPEHEKYFNLYLALANYDWHCKHHFEHIKLAESVFYNH